MAEKPVDQPLIADKDQESGPGAQFEKMNGDDEDGRVAFMQAPEGSSYIGLTKEELELYANDPKWKMFRMAMFALFWILWIAMFVAAIAIVVIAPKCPALPFRHWWENKISYSVVPHFYQDSDSDGFGDLAGIERRIPELKKIYVQTVHLAGSTKGSLPVAFAMSHDGTKGPGTNTVQNKELDEIIGGFDALESLATALHKKSMYLILDLLCVDVDTTLSAVEGIPEYLKRGVDGFVVVTDLATGSGSAEDAVTKVHDAIEKYKKEHEMEKEILVAVRPLSHGKTDVSQIEPMKEAAGLFYDGGLGDTNASTIVRALAEHLVKLNNETRANLRLNETQLAWQVASPFATRSATRYDEPALAELLMMMMFMLPGSVTHIYGDEIGLASVGTKRQLSQEQYQKSKFAARFPSIYKSCDAAAVMQWKKGQKNYGFSDSDVPVYNPPEKPDGLLFYEEEMAVSESPARLFKRMASLRSSDFAFLYGGLAFGPTLLEADGVLTISRHPAGIQSNTFVFAGNFKKGNATTVDLGKEHNLSCDGCATVAAMTTNLLRKKKYVNRGPIGLKGVELSYGEGIVIKVKSS